MQRETWDRLDEVFFRALELPPERRAAFLDEACAGDAPFRAEIAAVLAAHAAAGGTVDSDRLLTPVPEAAPRAMPAGTRVGVYELEELIGRGGMGEVYRARRADAEYEQQVAVKLVRAGRDTAELIRRLRAERQILARLQHPNIATLLDGGVTDGGQPYLVMQYVDGVPITKYAAEHGLDLAARLALFRTVCEAVQFAHANLVVHRDLKPSNILVDRQGEVRLLDFGIAKLLDPDSVGAASTTGDLLLLTPEHAAPEQFLGGPITTATDVYALGVLLFELLVGFRPFQFVPALELHRAVCERDPLAPSAAATDPGLRARRGDAPVPVAAGLLAGDLDGIVGQALRKEPDRRYASAGQLAEEIERHLDGRPVLAQPDTFGYRVSKFVRRNRLGVAAAAAIAITLVGATVVSVVQARARAVALAAAQVERAKATRLSDFLLGVFSVNDPSESRGRTVTARELLDRAAGQIERDLAEEPLVRADMALAIGRAYGALGLPEPATPLVERAVEDRRAHLAAGHPDLATALESLARTSATRGQVDRATTIGKEALAMKEAAFGPRDPGAASLRAFLARVRLTGDYLDAGDTARTALEQALDVQRGAVPRDARALATTLRFLGTLNMDQGRVDESLANYREAISVAAAGLGEDHPFLFDLTEDLALGYQAARQVDSAATLHRRVLAQRERVLGPDHLYTSYSYFNLGRLLGNTGHADSALPLLRRALEVRERAIGPDAPAVAFVLHTYAINLLRTGDLPGAVERLQRAIAIQKARVGARSSETLALLETLAIAQVLQNQRGRAIDALEDAVEYGYGNLARLSEKPFDQLSGEPRFQRLLDTLRRRSAEKAEAKPG